MKELMKWISYSVLHKFVYMQSFLSVRKCAFTFILNYFEHTLLKILLTLKNVFPLFFDKTLNCQCYQQILLKKLSMIVGNYF